MHAIDKEEKTWMGKELMQKHFASREKAKSARNKEAMLQKQENQEL